MVAALAIASTAHCGGPAKQQQTTPAAAEPSLDPASVPEEPVAKVDGHVLTNRKLLRRVLAIRAQGAETNARDALYLLIDEVLLASAGKRAGLETEPAVVEAREAARRRAAAELLIAEVQQGLTVDEATLREMFHDLEDSVDLDMVVYATREQAEAGVARLRGGTELEEEARHTLDPAGKAAKGKLGTKMRTQIQPGLAEHVFTAPLDEYAGPVEIELGWVVFRVRARHIGDEARFAARSPQLEKFALQQLAGQAKHHLLQQLRAEVELDVAFLEATGTAMTASPEQLDHVVATVRGRDVTYRDVLSRVRALSGGRESSHMSGPTVKQSMAWQVIDQVLLEHAAIDRGHGDAPEAVAAAARAERRALTVAFAARIRAEVPRVTAEQARAYYDDNLDQFEQPGRRTVAHLMVESKAIADALRARIDRGEKLGALAREYSLDGESAAKDGVLGTVDDRQLAAMEKVGETALARAIANAAPNAVVGPVQSASGWHLIRVTDVEPPAPVPFVRVQAAITANLQSAREVEAVRERAKQLRSGAAIQIDESALARAADLIERAGGPR